jgi:N-acetylneuraminic acid mutarotase
MMLAVLLLAMAAVTVAPATTRGWITKSPSYAHGRLASAGGGTPFAVLANVYSDTAAVYVYKPRILLANGNTIRGQFWVDSTSSVVPLTWGNDGLAWASCPTMTLVNPAESVMVWTEVRSVSDVPGELDSITLRIRRTATGTNWDRRDLGRPLTILDTAPTGNGGWLTGHIYQSSGGPALQNHVVLAYGNGGECIGSAITEDNRIIEGYNSGDAGFFYMALLAGTVDSLQVYPRTEYYNPVAHYTQISGPWSVSPGGTTWVDAGAQVENLQRSPQYPLSTEEVLVSARMFRTGGFIATDSLLWNAGSGWNLAPSDSYRLSDSTYFYHVPAQAGGSSVSLQVIGYDDLGNRVASPTLAYAVPVDHSIYQVQYCDTLVSEVSPDNGVYVHTGGVVTSVLTQTKFMIGNSAGGPWSGLYVYRRAGSPMDVVAVGDSIEVAGKIGEYNGLSQVDTLFRIDIRSQGNSFATTPVSFPEARLEAFESVVIELSPGRFVETGAFISSPTLYNFVDNSPVPETVKVYVTSGTPLVGTAIPQGYHRAVAGMSDYNGPQLTPHSQADFTFLAADVAVTLIAAPTGTMPEGQVVTPMAHVANLSLLNPATDFPVTMQIGAVYTQQVTGISIDPGASYIVTFPDWTAVGGTHVVTVFSQYAEDPDAANDTLRGSVTVTTEARVPWVAVSPMPMGSRMVKDGAWLTEKGDAIYAARGYKTQDFFAYYPGADADSWKALAPIPLGPSGRLPYKGAVGVAGDGDYIYATKGNNTSEFYRYNVGLNTWTQLPDVPLGLSGKRVKGGTALIYHKGHGTDPSDLYLMKGYKDEFYKYELAVDSWRVMPTPPPGARPKWDKGSWMVYLRSPGQNRYQILAHKSKYHEFYRYDIPTAAWIDTLPGMPVTSQVTGKTRKSKDGGCAALEGDYIYAFKGANTQEFWKFTMVDDSGYWTEAETIPGLAPGTTKRKRVKAGASIVYWGGQDGVYYALKGNKTNDLWKYTPAPPVYAPRPERDGVMAGSTGPVAQSMAVSPNPLRGGHATLSYSLPRAGTASLTVHDVTGRCVLERTLVAGRGPSSASLDLGSLGAGVYLVKLSGDGFAGTQKLVVEK